jgi:Kdo2-lipid IVA lauroyltransferase/acyltransferase
MRKTATKLLYVVLRLYASLPMPVLFFISDVFIFPIVYHIGRYRRRTVRLNLKNSFPDYSKFQIVKLERRFYHHFSDNFQETVRILVISQEEARRRMHFENMELLLSYLRKERGVLVLLGHYGNWEFQPFFFLQMPEQGIKQGFSVYRPLKNKTFDELMKTIRSHFGGNNVTKNETYRTIIRLRSQKLAGAFGLISDQSPSRGNMHYWTTFLNQDTSILSGPERMAKQTGFAVLYADVIKLGRGRYQTIFKLMSDEPEKTAEFEITEQYARLMEQTILRDPAYWLWTHKRWKHKRSTVSYLPEK